MDPITKPYWEKRGELTIGENLLLCGGRIVVPLALQEETLRKLHNGHQGIERCRLRARSAVWWPGISQDIDHFIKSCPDCCRNTQPNKEPLLSTPLPDYPWQKAATDLFILQGDTYLILVDYYSRFPEVIQLRSITSLSVINALKSIFARHGIPETLVSDNGPQYSSTEFGEFATAYGFVHCTSSPHYPQSNGHAERAVKTVKGLLKESTDKHLALLSYRTTPLPWCGMSPAELSQGRRLRSDIPQLKDNLIPQWPFISDLQRKDREFKLRQKKNFDRRHRVRPLPDIPEETDVWINTHGHQSQGQIRNRANAPQSYVIDTPTGTIRRNRSQLNIIPDQRTPSSSMSSREPILTRSRTGTTIAPPHRL